MDDDAIPPPINPLNTTTFIIVNISNNSDTQTTITNGIDVEKTITFQLNKEKKLTRILFTLL